MGSVSGDTSDLAAVLGSPEMFGQRLQEMLEIKNRHEQALAELNLGKSAKEAYAEAIAMKNAVGREVSAKHEAASLEIAAKMKAAHDWIEQAKKEAETAKAEALRHAATAKSEAEAYAMQTRRAADADSAKMLEVAKQKLGEAEAAHASVASAKAELEATKLELGKVIADTKAIKESADAMRAKLKAKLDVLNEAVAKARNG